MEKLESESMVFQADQSESESQSTNVWSDSAALVTTTPPFGLFEFDYMRRSSRHCPKIVNRALNYGALGYTLGHELTHGFDDYGRYHDKLGNFGQVWSDHATQEFDDRATCLVEQYDSYYVPEAKGYVNGNRTLGENIADNGGLREALRAYRTYVKNNGPEPLLPGFEDLTHEQLFFISFANTRCATLSSTDAGEILKDTYSPPKVRVLGALSNMVEFSEAFQCPRGSKMNPEKKCRVW